MTLHLWYERNTPNGPIMHCQGQDGSDYTLCGAAPEEDHECVEMERRTRGRITCRHCITLIQFCKTVPARRIGEPATD